MVLTDKFDNIGDAIRSKLFIETKIYLEDMPEAVRSINGGESSSTYAMLSRTALVVIDTDSKALLERTIDRAAAERLKGIEKIGDYAFYGSRQLLYAKIPEEVIYIGDGAFGECDKLDYVLISSDTPPEIGVEAFPDSTVLPVPVPAVSIYKSKWSEYSKQIVPNINIPVKRISLADTEGIPKIWYRACYNNGYIEEVELADTVKSISKEAFMGCTSLTKVRLSDNLTIVQYQAFRDCTFLTSIRIPISVKIMENFIFFDCNSLIIYCEVASKPDGWDSYWNGTPGVSNFPVVWDCNNNNTADDGYIYTELNSIRYRIKEGVAEANRSFTNVSLLEIPSSILYKDVSYPVVKIGKNFASYPRGRDSLETVIIPSSVTDISNEAFNSCTNLKTVHIKSASPPNIDYKSFPASVKTYYVPVGSLELYQTHPVWGTDFRNGKLKEE